MCSFGGDTPSSVGPPIPPPQGPPKIDQAALAKQQRSLNAKRKGKKALRVQPGLSSSTAIAGLRLPNA
jgi:hypothetical protein